MLFHLWETKGFRSLPDSITDYRLASAGDFYFSLETVFQVPKDEEGGSLILAIPFNSPDEGRFSVHVTPTNLGEKQIRCTAQYRTSSGVSVSTNPILAQTGKGIIEIERLGSQVVVSFTPDKGLKMASNAIEVPRLSIRPISLWMRCSPKASVVQYDLLRFKARTGRSPASLPPAVSQTNWLTWCTVGFLVLGITAGAIKLFFRLREKAR